MITINANKTTKEIEQMVAELKYWSDIWLDSPNCTKESEEANINRKAIYGKLSQLVTCEDCKYCKPPKKAYQSMYCSKLYSGYSDTGMCDKGLFEPKIAINHRFQMF